MHAYPFTYAHKRTHRRLLTQLQSLYALCFCDVWFDYHGELPPVFAPGRCDADHSLHRIAKMQIHETPSVFAQSRSGAHIPTSGVTWTVCLFSVCCLVITKIKGQATASKATPRAPNNTQLWFSATSATMKPDKVVNIHPSGSGLSEEGKPLVTCFDMIAYVNEGKVKTWRLTHGRHQRRSQVSESNTCYNLSKREERGCLQNIWAFVSRGKQKQSFYESNLQNSRSTFLDKVPNM